MQYRKLGRTGLEISDVGYGAWGIGGRQWQGGTDDESIRALHRAFELGLNFIDTALAYGEGHSERLVAQVLKTAPHRIFVATKIPPKNRLWPARPGTKIKDVFPRGYIVECTGESLRNLGVETIDLQQLHVWNPEWLEHDDWKRGLEDIKKSGKVRFVGISINDHQPDSALEIIKTGLIDTVQVIYNIFDQTPEQNLFALTQEANIGVIARVPFDEGSLTGTITEETNFGNDEFRAHYFRGDHKKQVVGHINKLKKDLEGEEGTLPEIALRFCLSHSAVSTVIPGMRKVRNVEANCAASDKGPLSEATLNKLKHHAWAKNFYS
jgi:aryl-alcohol dehydrogenase-like predicted oxidoreductase